MPKSLISRRDLVKGAAAAAACAAVANVAVADEAPTNRVCEALGIEKPVVQAIMNDLTSPELCAAVSNAGGLGILANPTREDIQATKALTDKPFGVGSNTSYDDELMAMLKEEGVDIAIVAPMPEIITMMKEAGFKTIVKYLGATMENILAVQEAGPDVIAIVGWGAGGCGPYLDVSASTLINEFKPQITVPMLVGGGIVDAGTASAGWVVGAEGAYVGTRFLVCEESPCSPGAQQVIIDSKAEDLVAMPILYGLVHCNKTPRSERVMEMVTEGVSIEERTDYSGTFYEMWRSMRDGDFEDYAVGMGNSVNLITGSKTAAEIVDDIASPFLA